VKIRSLAVLGTIAALALGAAACTTNRGPRFEMRTGEPEQFRRFTHRPFVDHIFRWNKQAFTKVENHLDDVVSEDKADVLRRHGQPEYVRTGVPSRSNERFDEWAYWDRNTICQFVQGELVYEGPMLDTDRWLIRHGYPSEALYQDYEDGPVREIWTYNGLFVIESVTVSFTDGVEVFRSEY
jgi:hypothetical protein